MAKEPEEAPEPTLVPMRITVLGGSQSGKTSLISAFVNNFCPSVYAETNDPAFYYKTLYLPNRDATDREPFPVLAEIEDTYASDRTDDADCYGVRRGSDYFYSIFQTRKGKASWAAAATQYDPVPDALRGCDPPKAKRLTAATYLRMSFMLVYDSNDEASWEEAKRAYERLQAVRTKEKESTVPVVFLVASKVDKEPGSRECRRLCAEGQAFAQQKQIEFVDVSAPELRKVKELFRRVLKRIQANPELWKRSARDGEGSKAPKAKSGRGVMERSSAAMRASAESGQRAVRAGQENCGVQ